MQHEKELSEDVVLPTGERAQCKFEANSFIRMYRLLETADLLALKTNNKQPLIVLPLDFFLKVYNGYRDISSLRLAESGSAASDSD